MSSARSRSATVASGEAASGDRMPAIPDAKQTEAQREAAREFAVQRKGAQVFGPFVPLLRSPEVMLRAAALGEYLRYRNVLPKKLSELVILIAARQWTQQFEWHHHYPIALESGLAPRVADAVAEGRRPDGMSEEEAIVYDFAMELHRNRTVSDATYARARDRFGEQGIIDLVGINGYYSLLAMAMNVARTPLPAGAEPALKPLPG